MSPYVPKGRYEMYCSALIYNVQCHSRLLCVSTYLAFTLTPKHYIYLIPKHDYHIMGKYSKLGI